MHLRYCERRCCRQTDWVGSLKPPIHGNKPCELEFCVFGWGRAHISRVYGSSVYIGPAVHQVRRYGVQDPPPPTSDTHTHTLYLSTKDVTANRHNYRSIHECDLKDYNQQPVRTTTELKATHTMKWKFSLGAQNKNILVYRLSDKYCRSLAYSSPGRRTNSNIHSVNVSQRRGHCSVEFRELGD